MSLLEKSIENIFKVNMGVKKREKVLIVIDKNKKKLGMLFFKIGKRFTKNIDLIEIPVGKVNGEEPPKEVTKKMLGYDVELLITTKSLTHTKARKNACDGGARVATLPNIQEGTLKRALNVDYKKMNERNRKINFLLDNGKMVNVCSKRGMKLEMSIVGRKARKRDDGFIHKKGQFGNLPTGESFIAPVEGTANGVCIIDGSIGGIGKVDKPVKIVVRNGYAKAIKGGVAAKRLSAAIKEAGKKAANLGEFGIGTNEKAMITGNLLEDEKVLGTCHIAFGNNLGFGGKIDVPLHMDCLIKKPTVFIDYKKVIDEGKLLL